MDTRELILKNALHMFSKSGYSGVSIRDIAKTVNIKESSIYYHFKNKQDILDSLIGEYEKQIENMTSMLMNSMQSMNGESPFSLNWLNEYYFEQYLFSPFCNQMMRLLTIEQFHDERIGKLYEHYLFDLPKSIQTGAFMMLAKCGMVDEQQAIKCGNDFFSNMTMLTFKYLLYGELTEEKKYIFCKETMAYIRRLLQEELGCQIY